MIVKLEALFGGGGILLLRPIYFAAFFWVRKLFIILYIFGSVCMYIQTQVSFSAMFMLLVYVAGSDI